VPDKRAVVSPVIPLPTASADPRREPDDDSGVNDERRSSMPPANSRGSAGRPSSAPSKLILVVDDEEEIRVMLKRVLVARSHRVIEADTGSLALSMVKQHIPDLVILDAMLPGLHGFDVARRLRASDRYGAIPIIMISAVYRGWRVKEDLRASYGIFDYLEKPFRLADVLEAAERALSAKTSESPGPDPDTLSASAAKALEEGIAAYRAGDIDRAIQLLAKGTELDPLAFRLHFHLALLYGKKDQVFDGIRQLELAVELSPKHFAALKNLALLYERAGFKNRAIEVWERAVHAAPDPVSKAQVKERLVALL
jgi:DNA-binding response OmpR family regulator